jgi:energy-coupling factor transporter ATP-binding protein EcfA2
MSESLEERTEFFVDEVFTPSSPAISCYVPRGEKINDKVVNALKTRGKQLVVYGHTGSGKTTLLINKLNQIYDNHITSNCMKTTTVDALMLDAFSQVSPFYESEHSVTEKNGRELFIETTFKDIKAGIKSAHSSDTTIKQTRLVPPQLNAQNLAKLLGAKGLCWVIEDFHKVEETEKQKLSQVMKIFMDCGAEYPCVKIITLGAVHTARQVVEYDDEMRNRVSEIEVQLMEQDEILQIISTGERRLNIEFSPSIKKIISKYSRGLPAVCHQLCLNACNAHGLMGTGATKVTISTDDIKKAIETYVEEASDSIRSKFEKALKINNKANHHYAKIILECMIDLPELGVGRIKLLQKIQKKVPTYTDASLKKTLAVLTGPAGGELVRYSHNSGLYSFSDPLYHAYAMSIFHTNSHSSVDIDSLELDFHTLVRLLEKELRKQGVQRVVEKQ